MTTDSRRLLTATVSDRVLVAAAQDGDLQAFGELVERHQAPMYRLALRMLGSEADAHDVGQEAFLQAWRSLGRFRNEASFSTWLYRIVTNQCLNAIAARRPVELIPEGYASGHGDVASAAEGRARFRAVTDAMERLPVEQRTAIVLRDLQGLAYEEIADVLELPLGTVKGRIHRGRLAIVRDVEGV